MRKIRRSKLSDLAAAAFAATVAVACAASCHAQPATSPTATEMPSATRHPDGVVLEPPAALPGSSLRAPARGVVALREPLGTAAVKNLVAEMVQALEREDPSAFDVLLTTDAAYYDAGHRLPRATLLEKWRQRMQQLDYSKLAGMEVVRPEDVRVFEYEDVGGPGEPDRPAEMQPGDVYVRAPVATSRIGSDKFFGDEFTLVLRVDDGRYRIASYSEEDAD